MNRSSHKVWPVALSNAGEPSLLPSKGGHIPVLHPGQFINISFSPSGSDGLDHYGVSFGNGYNLPMVVVPVHSGSGEHCMTAGCTVNLTSLCPPELRFSEESLGSKSACQVSGDPNFCCTSNCSNGPGLTDTLSCDPNFFTKIFKKACPKANSFVDDTGSLFSCPLGQDYSLIFCPSPSTTSNKQQLKLTILAAIFVALAFIAALLKALWRFGDGISICNNNSNNTCCNCFNKN
ncbi:hypothetical protein FEM48_Zijuj05G0037600 [Ziziphus jujuba var. spinosa]|uniref:Thaumatin-like protein n=1 Tax=Ziziphus jujuba var. spinosa TaxID=714518 RepID=A0A978VCM6_ZIZJJ|nr:hypothetical protein FEM48_Zijuj05G0037600 [Ziziphus jujuba var. spinosa]